VRQPNEAATLGTQGQREGVASEDGVTARQRQATAGILLLATEITAVNIIS